MTRNFPWILPLINLVLAVASSCFAAEREVPSPLPDDRAALLASESGKVTDFLKRLRSEASRIRDVRLKDSSLEILERPNFRVVAERVAQGAVIQKQLLAAKLLDPKKMSVPLFPAHAPMRFVGAPASFWVQHHSYPGGLVFHTWVNLRSGLALSQIYREVYGVALDEDLLRAAAIWHDSAKAMTLEWKRDGTATLREGQIVGTGSHHLWAVAEALYRSMPVEFVVTLAAAHNPPTAKAGLDEVQGYLKAAAIIAGKPFSAAGLTEDGARLATDPPIEAAVHHLSDHDWVVSQISMPKVQGALDREGVDHWKAHRLLADEGDLALHALLLKEGHEGLRRKLSSRKMR